MQGKHIFHVDICALRYMIHILFVSYNSWSKDWHPFYHKYKI